MELIRLFSVSFILCVCTGLSGVLAQPSDPDTLVGCFSLPDDIGEAEPIGSDVQIYQRVTSLWEQENRSTGKPSYDLLRKIEGFVPRIQSSEFRGGVVVSLINEYIGLDDIREVERLVDEELRKPDVNKETVLRVTNAFVTCQSDVAKCKKLLTDVLQRSDLSRKQRFYFKGRYALLCGAQEKLKFLGELETEFPERKTCLGIFMEQAAHSLLDKNPEEAFKLVSKISGIAPQLFKDARVVQNCMFFAEKVNKLESAIEIGVEFVQAEPNHPDSLEIFHRLGGLFFDLGNYEKSVEYYQKVIDFPMKDANNKSLISTAKTNYAVAYSRLNKISFIPYEYLNYKVEKSEWGIARSFFLISGSVCVILWFFLLVFKNKRKN
jgi:tetratricopeptide (TPR) repeat protein